VGLVEKKFNWEDYSEKFTVLARNEGRDAIYAELCLSYAHRLYSNNIPIIYDVEHLCKLVGYDKYYVLGASYETEKFYRKFKIPKKSGGFRTIHEPLPSLKEIQRWILDNILYNINISKHAKGFIHDLSIKDNAKYHRNQPCVLSLDIKDFFPSIMRHRVYGIYRSIGYTQLISNILSRICTLNESLPQGAPTSPALSNIICFNLDRRLAGFSKKYDYRYTRYADDITISGNIVAGRVIRFVKKILGDYDLFLNDNKTRLMQRHQRQEVTGIVVNEKMQTPKEIRRHVRQEVYYINKYGMDSHLDKIKDVRSNYVKHIIGIVNYIKFVNPNDRHAAQALSILMENYNKK